EWKAKSIGAALGTIIAIIITGHIAKHSANSAAPQRPIGISHMKAARPPLPRIASIAAARITRYSHDSSVSASRHAAMTMRSPRASEVATLMLWAARGSARPRPAPVEREVLARLAAAVPFEAEAVGTIGRRDTPGGDLPRPDFGARCVVNLNALARQRRRPGQRLRLAQRDAGDLDAPARQVARHLEIDVCRRDAAHRLDQRGEAGHPAARLPAPDGLYRLLLSGIGTVVDVDRHLRLRTGPEVAGEGAQRDHAE